jgi:hypothetical protein
MESITMTTSTQISRVRSACPQANPIRLAATRARAQGTTVSAVASGARGVSGLQARPAFYLGGSDATGTPKTPAHNSMDVAHLRSRETPV